MAVYKFCPLYVGPKKVGEIEQVKLTFMSNGEQLVTIDEVGESNGVITSVDAEPGMVVAAGAPVVRLAHDGPRDVVFNVPEDRVAELRALAGQAGALKVQVWNNGQAPIALPEGSLRVR